MFRHQKISGYVLDVGCGHGDIMFRFARSFHDCVIHGIDGSETMIQYGRKFLEKAGDVRKEQIQFIQGVLPDIILPGKKYDIIISNSLLHHLHDPYILWKAVKYYAATEAQVFIMDLKRPETIEEARRLTETYVANEPEILKRDFYNSLLAAYEVDEVKEQLKVADLGYLSVQETSDRHMVIAGNIK